MSIIENKVSKPTRPTLTVAKTQQATVMFQPKHKIRRGQTPIDIVMIIAGLLGGVVLGTAVVAVKGQVSSPGGWFTAVGVVSALVGTYLCMVLLVLAARVPLLERRIGQDRLIAYHRLLGPWAVTLIAIHVVTIIVG